jgi:parallel beta-helix repeat protein
MYDASNNNTITENTVTHHDFCGINIYISSNNNITRNTIADNNVGIHVPADKYENHISDNIFSNNKNNIEKESGISIFELTITIIILVGLTVFILFWREKSHKKAPISKDTKYYLDARGNLCPIPLIMTKKKIAKMNKGEVLEIITKDFVAKENIERFGKKNHELIRIDEEGKIFKIYIKK